MLKTTWSAKNLLALIVKDAEVSSGNGDCEDKTVKKSLFKNLNRVTGYTTPNAKKAVI